MKNILIVFGTRPEAIKMAPVVHELKKYPELFIVKICVTGQHRQMLDQVLLTFDITPDYDLNIMRHGQDLFDVSTSVLMGIRDVLESLNPEIVLVHGDTTTALATSMACYYKNIKIAHIEAGLRTNNINSPWPEEMNRQFIDRISNYLFCPTLECKNNLLKENINNGITITGNTVIDSLFYILNKIKNNKGLKNNLILIIRKLGYNFSENNNKKIILVTGHRRENFGEGFLNICKAIKKIAENNPDIDIVYPVHLNPNVQKPVMDILSNIPNIFLIKPLDYEPFVLLMSNSYLILTDSGGIQEEAPSLGKPVLVMRENTERPEAIEAGTVKLVGISIDTIYDEVEILLKNPIEYFKMNQSYNPYGDGNASKKIIEKVK
jgi:UDP-N-acetylglucosamine 2-epimerase (non-hydrolysing)